MVKVKASRVRSVTMREQRIFLDSGTDFQDGRNYVYEIDHSTNTMIDNILNTLRHLRKLRLVDIFSDFQN